MNHLINNASVIEELLHKLIPLFALIVAGFVFARLSRIDYAAISKLLLYLITPFIMLHAGLTSTISISMILLPFSLFLAACLTSLVAYAAGKWVYSNSDKNLLAYTAGASNTGYFGLPLVAATLGGEYFNTAAIAGIGMIVYEFTLGFYLAAKGNFHAKDCLKKLFRLPHIYAFAAGLTANLLQSGVPEVISSNAEYFKGAYTLLGMLLIGFGLNSIRLESFDLKFITLNLIAKNLCIPLAVIVIVRILAVSGWHVGEKDFQVLLLLSLTPVAANAVNFAKELDLNVSKAAVTVLISTLLALPAIPVLSAFILKT